MSQAFEVLQTIGRFVKTIGWWLLRWHPWLALTSAVAAALAVYDRYYFTMFCLVVPMLLLVWWLRSPDSFDRWVAVRARSSWRREVVYNAAWDSALSVCRQKEFMSLLGVRSDGYSDLVHVRVHTPPMAGWTPIMEPLRKVFNAYNATLLEETRDRATLRFRYRDRLAEVVPPFLVPVDQLDLRAVPVGITEDGEVFTLRVQGTHTLIGGCSDSGKSGAIWSLLHSLSYAIREGLIQIWGCDPKGGMELTKGEPLFARYAMPDVARGKADAEAYEPMVKFLEDAASLMLSRAARLRTTTRKHEPTPDDPAVIVIIDELLTFTDHLPDGLRLRERAKNAIKILLTQGRSTGVSVVGAVQDPHKDTVKLRDLFLERLALRMTEEEQVDMVLGDGARRRGALCDQIKDWEHGVGYFRLNNQLTPTRIRIAWVDDERCDWLAAHFQPPASAIEVPKLEVPDPMDPSNPPLDASDEEALEFLRSQQVNI